MRRVRILIVLVSALIAVAGCKVDQASGSIDGGEVVQRPSGPSDAASIIVEAVNALQVAGVPQAPLSVESTRQERSEYLVATERARELLRLLPSAEPAEAEIQPALQPVDRSQEILTISPVLAVELADAIDRGDEERAQEAINIAVAYADFTGSDSITSWLSVGTVYDTLVQGLRSVPGQMDAPLAQKLIELIGELDRGGPEASLPLRRTIRRLEAWQDVLAGSAEPVAVETVLMSTGGDSAMRPAVAPELEEAIGALAKADGIPAGRVAEEAGYFVSSLKEYYRGIEQHQKTKLEMPAPTEHPIAAFYFVQTRTSLEAAPNLGALRSENLKMLGLTVRLLAADLPAELEMFGEEAVSPLNGLVFDYTRTEAGFEIKRPRAKA